MNRRDGIVIFIFAVWLGFWLFFTDIFSNELTPNRLVVVFAITLIILLAVLVMLLVLSLVIEPFGEWGDKKIFNNKSNNK